MEYKTQIKFVRISPLKLRTITDYLKRLSPKVALDHLSVNEKRNSKILFKAIKSAVDNSAKAGVPVDQLKFKALAIDEGPFLKRFRAGSRGMGKSIKRKSSHITVVLTVKEEKVAKKSSQVAKAKEVKAVPKKVEPKKKVKKVVKSTKTVKK